MNNPKIVTNKDGKEYRILRENVIDKTKEDKEMVLYCEISETNTVIDDIVFVCEKIEFSKNFTKYNG